MIFSTPLLPGTLALQIEKTLSSMLTEPIDEERGSETEHLLWSLLTHPHYEPPPDVEQNLFGLTDEPDAALLLGLLLKKRQATSMATRAILVQKDAFLTGWLQQQLITAFPERVSAMSQLVFHYLILTQANTDWVADLLGTLAQQHPLTNWDPGRDLTLESGTTGWLLVVLNARRLYAESLRIQKVVKQIDAYLIPYVDYLHSHQIPVDSTDSFESLFPTSVSKYDWKLADQQSWGQGDLGHLLLLYKAERLLGRPQLTEWAHRLGGYLIHLRQTGRLHLTNPGLMTGTAGVSLLYRQLYELTGQQRYFDEGIYWLNRTMKMVQQTNQQTDFSLKSGRLGIICTLKQWLGHDVGLDLLHL